MRCRQRGYTLKEVAPCVVAVNGDQLTVDTSHASYPRHPRKSLGPGTELKALLAKFGIHASPTCGCNAMAQKMNEWGEESLDHIDEIVDVMQETAAKRGLPFVRLVGAQLVKTAVRRWKRANSK